MPRPGDTVAKSSNKSVGDGSWLHSSRRGHVSCLCRWSSVCRIPSLRYFNVRHLIATAIRRLWHGKPYQRLNPSKREICLLKLLPARSGSDGTTIKCEISVRAFNSGIKVDALSYSWGDPSEYEVIRLNTQPYQSHEICAKH